MNQQKSDIIHDVQFEPWINQYLRIELRGMGPRIGKCTGFTTTSFDYNGLTGKQAITMLETIYLDNDPAASVDRDMIQSIRLLGPNKP